MGRFDSKDGNPGRYSAAGAAVLLDGDSCALRTDATGALVTSGGGGATYNTTPPTIANGQSSTLQADQNGNLKVREQYAPVAEDNTNGVFAVACKPVVASAYSATAFMADSDVDYAAKTNPGQLFSVYAYNGNAALRFLQLFNQTAIPTSGNTPVLSFVIPIGGVTEMGSEFFGENGYYFSTGISIGISSTRATFTAATAADHLLNGTFL